MGGGIKPRDYDDVTNRKEQRQMSPEDRKREEEDVEALRLQSQQLRHGMTQKPYYVRGPDSTAPMPRDRLTQLILAYRQRNPYPKLSDDDIRLALYGKGFLEQEDVADLPDDSPTTISKIPAD